MRLIYSSTSVKQKHGCEGRNPSMFLEPEEKVSEVFINGNYPEIQIAYEAAGVKVSPLSELKPILKGKENGSNK